MKTNTQIFACVLFCHVETGAFGCQSPNFFFFKFHLKVKLSTQFVKNLEKEKNFNILTETSKQQVFHLFGKRQHLDYVWRAVEIMPSNLGCCMSNVS